ncbi:MAG: hypothetical protein MJE68_10915, partial [Proteobacteria bacterium]|nr:hypothetical protein [Pseudomonadota bacterium]
MVYIPENMILLCANSLYGIHFESSGDEPVLKHIKSIKVKNSIHDDGKFEDLKKSIVNKVLSDVKSKTIEELKEEYSYYIEFVTNLNDKIKEVN